MHLLHITPYYAPAWAFGGVARAVTGLASAQAARGHRVTVLTTDALDFQRRNPVLREQIDGVQVIRCRNLSHALRARLNLSSPWPGQWRAVLRNIRADVIHAHELRTVENLLTLPHLRRKTPLTRAPGDMPFVLSPHGTLTYAAGRSVIKRAWDRLFGRSLARWIDHIAGLTIAEIDDAHALWKLLGVPFPGASVIPNGVSADLADQVASAPDLRIAYELGDSPVVLFFGRLHERKGLQFLIPAFARIAGEFPDARLMIAGPDAGMLGTLRALVRDCGVADRVVFTGLLTGAARYGALRTGDIFVLPAVGEGLPMSALEAMAAGLPLILTPGCNLPEVAPRGAGLLVEREIAAIGDALRTLLADAPLRRAMGERGQAWVHESFAWPAIAAQTEALYATLHR